ncbi:MAG: hypothetical protein ABR879_05465 [Methanomassiliicoccales archaeon]|jgi:hypothetical protein
MEACTRQTVIKRECELAMLRNIHTVERPESEISPDVYAQIFVGWRAPPSEPKGPSDLWGPDRDRFLGGRLAKTDFVEKVREFLDHGFD